MKIELYPNQIFQIYNKYKTEKDEIFLDILLANGIKSNVKVVEPIPIDKTRTKLEGTTSKRLDESIKEIIGSKYKLKKIILSEEVLDEIDDIIDSMKLPRKDKRKKQEELEKTKEEEIRNKLITDEINSFYTNQNTYQVNGLFLDNETFNRGLLQIPSDIRFKARNIHLMKNDSPILNIEILNSNTHQSLTFKEFKKISNDDIQFSFSINYLTNKNGYKDIFDINDFLINKLSNKKDYNKYDLFNLLFIKINDFEVKSIEKNKKDNVKLYNNILNKNIIWPLKKIINKYKIKSQPLSEEDQIEIKRLYQLFFNVFISYDDSNDLYIKNQKIFNTIKTDFYGKLPTFVKIYLSIYIKPEKRKDLVNYFMKDWLNQKESFFNIIKNKDKIDYFSKLDDLVLINIVGQFKFNKIYNDDNNLILNPIYHYPAEKDVKMPTPRMMGYSFLDGTDIPNIIPCSTGKNRGFIIDLKSIELLRK